LFTVHLSFGALVKRKQLAGEVGAVARRRGLPGSILSRTIRPDRACCSISEQAGAGRGDAAPLAAQHDEVVVFWLNG
jgi:hypothetical protein